MSDLSSARPEVSADEAKPPPVGGRDGVRVQSGNAVVAGRVGAACRRVAVIVVDKPARGPAHPY
ncbi:hypothetical protein [Mycobacterium camsae]|uniref:hypothetical protein n=1 Tax=Mycobacterium gordonae TaxID=1778 RepID=UPI00198074D7|nr:hypothetical protein [Mycobacterium gordonae]